MRKPLGFSLLLLLAPLATADSITKTDGTVLEDVTIVEETLEGVSYTSGRSKKAELVPADEVRSVAFTEMPEEVDAAMGSISEGDPIGALSYLEEYVEAQIEKPSERRHKWAPAWSAAKTIELRIQLLDLEGAVRAADRLIRNYGDSRYAPAAHMQKAYVQSWMGENADAEATLSKLSSLAEDKGLSKRWALAIQIAKARLDAPGAAQRAALSAVARDAGSSHPELASLAKMAEGESFMLEAEGITNQSQAGELRKKAQRIFEDVVQQEQAGPEALAGAYTGLGDCWFFQGAATENEAALNNAVKSYLRVAIVYPEQGQYVPKALFYAMRCFDLLGDRTRKYRMRSELLTLYPGSSWAERPELKR